VIEGETIAEFDAKQMRRDGQSGTRMRVSLVTSQDVVLGIQSAWNAAAHASTFHWPAIFNRNSQRHMFAIHDGDGFDRCQALLQCRSAGEIPCDRTVRRIGIYVSFVEIAPWNVDKRTSEFVRLGTVAMLFAVSLNHAQEDTALSAGSVGLHAVDQAAAFYRKLGFEAVDCLNEYKEVYLELSRERGVQLTRRFGAMS
jgi:hypothetical protein